MPKLLDKYYVCLYTENANTKNFQGPVLRRVVDNIVFNPEKDPQAKEHCLARKSLLTQRGRKFVRAFFVTEVME